MTGTASRGTSRPRRLGARFAGLAVAVGLPVALSTGCTSSATASKDVTVTACNADASGGRPNADGTIVNHSSKASTYIIKVNFYDSSGNNVSQGADTLGKVEPNATATFHLQGLASAKGPLTCKVATVSRTQAP